MAYTIHTNRIFDARNFSVLLSKRFNYTCINGCQAKICPVKLNEDAKFNVRLLETLIVARIFHIVINEKENNKSKVKTHKK